MSASFTVKLLYHSRRNTDACHPYPSELKPSNKITSNVLEPRSGLYEQRTIISNVSTIINVTMELIIEGPSASNGLPPSTLFKHNNI